MLLKVEMEITQPFPLSPLLAVAVAVGGTTALDDLVALAGALPMAIRADRERQVKATVEATAHSHPALVAAVLAVSEITAQPPARGATGVRDWRSPSQVLS